MRWSALPEAAAARQALGTTLFDYMTGRADDAHTAPDEDTNAAAFARHTLVPRLIHGGDAPDLAVTFAGRALAAPLIIGAFAGDQVFHPEGLLPIARVCKRLGLAQVISEETVTPLAQITAANPASWLQLRAAGPVERVARIMQAASAQGAAGIILTLLAPVHPRPGQRPGGFDIGAELRHRGWSTIGTQLDGTDAPGVAALVSFPRWGLAEIGQLADLAASLDLPLVVKGVLHPADAAPLMAQGLAGLIVSNIGLRQSGRWVTAVAQLPAIRAAVPDAPLLLDGGIRHAADIVVGRLLGADLAVATRPVLSALAGGGEAAVEAWLTRIIDGLFTLTAWMGAERLADLTPDQLQSA